MLQCNTQTDYLKRVEKGDRRIAAVCAFAYRYILHKNNKHTQRRNIIVNNSTAYANLMNENAFFQHPDRYKMKIFSNVHKFFLAF